IFNDGTRQTADLNTTAGIRYYDSGWLASAPANRCPSSMTVYFKPPSNWTSIPRIHYWNAVPTGSVANTTWPGITMVAHTNGFYKYTITGATAVNIVFNNGNSGSANQTPDLMNKSDGYSYTWGVAPRIRNNNDSAFNASLFPNPVLDNLNIASDLAIENYKIITIQGAVIRAGKPYESGIDLSEIAPGLYFVQLRFANGEEETQRIIKK
ncbi:MAG: starch-binding protein, partial [Bacteroidota bacterium]